MGVVGLVGRAALVEQDDDLAGLRIEFDALATNLLGSAQGAGKLAFADSIAAAGRRFFRFGDDTLAHGNAPMSLAPLRVRVLWDIGVLTPHGVRAARERVSKLL